MTTETPAPDAEPGYLARVERLFGLRRGGQVLLSPRDWALVHDWEEQGLPVEVVLRGINRAFDLFAASRSRGEQINSLRYCRQHVEAAWQEHRERLSSEGSARDQGALTDAAEHLRTVGAACLTAAAQAGETDIIEAWNQAAVELETLAVQAAAGALGARQLDEAATALEQRLRRRLGGRDARTPHFSPWA